LVLKNGVKMSPAVDLDRQRIRRQRQIDPDRLTRQLGLDQAQGVAHHIVGVATLEPRPAVRQQAAQPLQDAIGAPRLVDDRGGGAAQVGRVDGAALGARQHAAGEVGDRIPIGAYSKALPKRSSLARGARSVAASRNSRSIARSSRASACLAT